MQRDGRRIGHIEQRLPVLHHQVVGANGPNFVPGRRTSGPIPTVRFFCYEALEPHRGDLLVRRLTLGRDVIRKPYRTHRWQNLTKECFSGEQREIAKIEPTERQKIEGIKHGREIERHAGYVGERSRDVVPVP